jgi:hypothetical protein
LAELLDASLWSNAVLLPGDVSRNSETTVLLENFLEKYTGQVTLTKDAADLLVQQPFPILHRADTLLVVAIGQLRRLGAESHYPRAFTSEMGLVQLIDSLHEFTKRFAFSLITRHQNHYIVAMGGKVSTTPVNKAQPVWRLQTAAHASVWWLQNASRPFEALTTAVYEPVER